MISYLKMRGNGSQELAAMHVTGWGAQPRRTGAARVNPGLFQVSPLSGLRCTHTQQRHVSLAISLSILTTPSDLLSRPSLPFPSLPLGWAAGRWLGLAWLGWPFFSPRLSLPLFFPLLFHSALAAHNSNKQSYFHHMNKTHKY